MLDKPDKIERLRRGDDDLLREIYDTYRPDFLRWALRQGLSQDEAEEVFQISVVVMYDNVVTGKLSELTSSLKTYLFSIGKHKTWETMRKKHHGLLYVDPAFMDMLGDRDDDADVRFGQNIERLKGALRKLGDPCKKLIEMMYYQKIDQTEISMVMGYKDRDTVKSKKYKCIEKLKKILENPDYETDYS